MNFKTTYGLFGGLLLIVSIFALTQMFVGSKAPTDDLVFPTIKEAKVEDKDITLFEIDRPSAPNEKLVFERPSADQRWRLVKPYNTRVDSQMVDNLVREVMRLKREEASSELSRDLKVNGLDPPSLILTIGKGSEKTWTLSLGNESPGSARKKLVYVVSSDHPSEPLAVSHQDLDSAYKKAKDFREKALVMESNLNALTVGLSDGKADVSLAKVEGPGHGDIGLQQWRFTKPDLGEADYQGEGNANIPPGQIVQRIAGVKDLLVAIDGLRVAYNPDQKVDDFVADNVSDADLASKYGLAKGKPKTLRIEVKSKMTGLRPGDEVSGSKGTTTDALLIGEKIPSAKPKDKEKEKADPKDKEKEKADPKDKDKPDPKDKDKPDPKDKDKPDPKDKADPKEKEKEKAEPKDKEPADDPDAMYYARLESENNVVRLPAKAIKPLLDALNNTFALRNKDLVVIDVSKTDAIDIKNGANVVKLRKVGEPAKWQLFEDGKFRDADQGSVMALLNVFTTRNQVKDFPTQPDDQLGLDDKSNPIEVSFWLDAIKDKKDVKTEPKLGKETVKLALSIKPEKEVVYVKRQRDKDTIRLAVPEGILGRVNEGKLAFLDRKLPVFGPDDEIVKVVIARPDETIELDKEKKDDKDKLGTWKLKQPKDQAGRTADRFKVEMILDTLRDLRAEKLVTEKATDPELDRFGLKPGDYQVTVTLKKGDKTEDKVFLFGHENDKKDSRYAKQGERDMVFLVRPNVIEPLKAKELVELQVFHFDPAKVRALKVSGWRDLKEGTRILDADFKEPKPGEPRVWTLTEDNKKLNPDFQLDGTKTAHFIAGIARLSASRFLVFKTGPKPEHKVDEKERTLLIEVTLEGDDKKPLTLTLGAVVGEGDMKGLAAQSSTLPGDVFVVPEAVFEKVLKDGLKFFSK